AACLLLAALLAGMGVASAHAAQVESVQVTTRAGHTRAVIHLSGPFEYKLFQLSNPGRVVLDFSDSSLRQGFVAPSRTGLLKDIRTGRRGKNGLRLVLDVRAKAQPKSFRLEPANGHGHQLVVDLYGAGTAGTRNARQSALN